MPRYANPAFGRYGTDPAWAQLGSTLATALFGDPQARAQQEQQQAEIDRLAAATEYDRERTTGARFENDAVADLADPGVWNILAPRAGGGLMETPGQAAESAALEASMPNAPRYASDQSMFGSIRPVAIPPSTFAPLGSLAGAMGMAEPSAPAMPSTGLPSIFMQGERPTRTVTTTSAPVSAGGGDRSQPRGFRNNNPGNIMAGNFTQGRPGFAGSDGRFARFQTMDQGVAAMDALLGNYMSGGRNTVRSIISRWAPAHENDTGGYIATIARAAGVSPDTPITPAAIPSIRNAMIRVENGRGLPGNSSVLPTSSGGGAVTTSTAVGPTPLAQATVPDATYVPEPEGQPVDMERLSNLVRLLVMSGEDNPARIAAAITGYSGDDRTARGALISQGNSPSETFAATRERADNIATRDAQSELVRAIATGNLDQAGDTLRNDADNATEVYNNNVDASTTLTANREDNATTRRGQDINSADERRGQDLDATEGGRSTGGRAANRDLSAADIQQLDHELETIASAETWAGLSSAQKMRARTAAQQFYAQGLTPTLAAARGLQTIRPANTPAAAPSAPTGNRVVSTPTNVIRYDAQGNRIH